MTTQPIDARGPTCRLCGTTLIYTFVDLGMSPLCEAYVTAERLDEPEACYPLHAYVCHACFLVQLEEFASPAELFAEYPYFSSYADTWVAHARDYVAMAIPRFGLGPSSLVVEVASNDGYLLEHVVAAGIPALGIEPAANVAAVAVTKGVPTVVEFFGLDTARALVGDHGRADLLIGNNVLAHTPHLHDFIAGLATLLSDTGVLTMEFPHLLRLIEEHQFDTIYHEHFSYFSFFTVERAFREHGITLFDVDELPTHGGSLRIFGRHESDATKPVTPRVDELRTRELAAGVADLARYADFGEHVQATQRALVQFLSHAKDSGQRIVAYGAAGKGNTLLYTCGIGAEVIDFVVDRNPHKQGWFTPGTHLPIRPPDALRDARPDLVLVLAWNLAPEIIRQVAYIHEWGGQFVLPIPTVRIVDASDV